MTPNGRTTKPFICTFLEKIQITFEAKNKIRKIRRLKFTSGVAKLFCSRAKIENYFSLRASKSLPSDKNVQGPQK